MSRPPRRVRSLRLVLLLTAATVAAGAVRAVPALSQAAAPEVKQFQVSGEAHGLQPGVTATLRLTLVNPNATAILVRQVTTSVGSAGGGCLAGNLTVSGLAAPVPVPARGTSHATVSVRMSAAAPPSCQGRTFPLTYGGRADRL